ncbi:MAG: LamG domain-containing protein, partial [ANME-2 cluster archaeon]|nr:LamG domain-containing protein [ANME-2 cluster archaeon]
MTKFTWFLLLALATTITLSGSADAWSESDCLHGYNFSNTVEDAGTGGLDGSITGSDYSYVSVDTGTAIYLEGTDAYVDFSNRLLPTGDWTLATRVRTKDLPADVMNIMVVKDSTLIVQESDGTYPSYVNFWGSTSGSAINLWSNQAVVNDAWTEIMVIYDS